MRIMILVTLTVSATLAVIAQAPPSSLILDLVGYRRSVDRPKELSGVPAGTIGRSSRAATSPSFELTLVSVDQRAYSLDDSLVYEVRVKNVGKGPIVLPWSPERDPFEEMLARTPEPSTPVIRAAIFLEVRSRDGTRRLAWLEPQALYGSATVAGSLATVVPGEAALIRIPSRWRATETDTLALRNEQNRTLQLVAVFDRYDSAQRVYSVNAIEASLERF
jgi:hypothetical protein